jgi:RNA-directed DNA polymerase
VWRTFGTTGGPGQIARNQCIPKSDGGQRPCGLAPVRERVGQPACQLVIEPICEANCQAPSDGCRPKRGGHHTVKAVKQARIRGWWVVEAAIPYDFDSIDHPLRVRLVARRRRERRVWQRIRRWRNAGVVAQGQWPPTEVGSPPGGASAPCWRTSTGMYGTGPG